MRDRASGEQQSLALCLHVGTSSSTPAQSCVATTTKSLRVLKDVVCLQLSARPLQMSVTEPSLPSNGHGRCARLQAVPGNKAQW